MANSFKYKLGQKLYFMFTERLQVGHVKWIRIEESGVTYYMDTGENARSKAVKEEYLSDDLNGVHDVTDTLIKEYMANKGETQ